VTGVSSVGSTSAPVQPQDWVWDSSALVHFARADRCADLFDIVRAKGARHLVTPVVHDELTRHHLAETVLIAGWVLLEDPNSDVLDADEILLELSAQLDVRGPHNLGEATVLAVAERWGATAVVDDRDAYSIGRSRGARVVRTLRLVGEAVETGLLTPHAAQSCITDVEHHGARLPDRVIADFSGWWAEMRTRL
jgi:predicted nucleic acid-binding protein